MDQSKKHYHYFFENGENHYMTPVEAHKYAYKHKMKITSGPNYREGRKEKAFSGWGFHDSLQRSFRGPRDYRDYLKANGMEEAGMNDCPVYKDFEPPMWTEELIWKAINVYGIHIGSVMADALLSGELDYPE